MVNEGESPKDFLDRIPGDTRLSEVAAVIKNPPEHWNEQEVNTFVRIFLGEFIDKFGRGFTIYGE